jgi:hypothetical protein
MIVEYRGNNFSQTTDADGRLITELDGVSLEGTLHSFACVTDVFKTCAAYLEDSSKWITQEPGPTSFVIEMEQ